MTHPLVTQLRFTRSELKRGLQGITGEEARRRFMPMNCISWIIAHLANQEQSYWLYRAQGKVVIPELNELAGYGKPASTPSLDMAWDVWHKVTEAADPYLDSLTTEMLTTFMIVEGKPHVESIGSMLRRMTYHYWYQNKAQYSGFRAAQGH